MVKSTGLVGLYSPGTEPSSFLFICMFLNCIDFSSQVLPQQKVQALLSRACVICSRPAVLSATVAQRLAPAHGGWAVKDGGHPGSPRPCVPHGPSGVAGSRKKKIVLLGWEELSSFNI